MNIIFIHKKWLKKFPKNAKIASKEILKISFDDLKSVPNLIKIKIQEKSGFPDSVYSSYLIHAFS